MTLSQPRAVEHTVTVSAPAADIYHLLADVRSWPRLFPPTIYVDHLERARDTERIRIWATANGVVNNWTSRRVLDRENLRIDFRQEVSRPPVAEMGGAWIVEPLSATESRVRLLHDYRADAAENLDWVDRAVDTNSRSELTALKSNVELGQAGEDRSLSFEDTVEIRGSVSEVYAFINEANLWSERLPHVSSVRLDEDEAGLQTLEMETRSPDGSTHTTKSYRVTFPDRRIAYKQVTLPALMSLHTGYWSFEQRDDVVAVSSQHTFVVNTDNVRGFLGADATVADAKDYVRDALSNNSRATLGHAKAFAENGR
ncbi:aromatase/cyclase [Actinokineospora sp. G85]|uniref:aromatase/cyclase n=1 Tax=Actinokineospora sp. G85 TaxID=3406626 RepID=UPI003C766678